jgi:FixJ family two-component response regulator
MKSSREVVYLVDDDVRIRESIVELLESLGFEAIAFESAAAYLAHTRNDEASCMVLDVELPDINGLELQKRLVDEDTMPIIFISGHGDVPTTVRAMKAGAIEFLTKPVDEKVLVDTVRGALLRDRKIRQKRAEVAELNEKLASLSPREREVFPLIIGGLLNKQAASVLGISEVTIQVHRGSVMRKMGAASFADLVRMAARLGVRYRGVTTPTS